MKSKFACAIITWLAIVWSGNVFADVDGDGSHYGRISIGGTIRPGPCEIDIGHNGHLDFGRIGIGQLSRSDATALEPKQLPFHIRCAGPTAVAISSSDDMTASNPFQHWSEENRDSALLGDIKGVLQSEDEGLPVGVYTILTSGVRAITEGGKELALKAIGRDIPGGSWESKVPILNVGMRQLSWSVDGKTPATATEFYGEFVVAPIIRPTKDLNITRAIEFRGQSTITITY